MEDTTELQEDLKEIGIKLIRWNRSIYMLAELLDHAEKLLSKVKQNPSPDMVVALRPLRKGLIRPEFLYHSEIGIRAYVASCLHEVFRIAASDLVYNENTMQEIFKVTVKLFEGLSVGSGYFYTRAASILKKMADFKTCWLMLRLEDYKLVIYIFEMFCKIVRPDHPPSIISSMETIMTFIIDEIDKMPLNLLLWLLHILLLSPEQENQNASPFSCNLGQMVFKKCASKLKTHLHEAFLFSASKVYNQANIDSSTGQDVYAGYDFVLSLCEKNKSLTSALLEKVDMLVHQLDFNQALTLKDQQSSDKLNEACNALITTGALVRESATDTSAQFKEKPHAKKQAEYDSVLSLLEKNKNLSTLLKEVDELVHQPDLNQAFIVKERQSSGELEEACKALIMALEDTLNSLSSIGIVDIGYSMSEELIEKRGRSLKEIVDEGEKEVLEHAHNSIRRDFKWMVEPDEAEVRNFKKGSKVSVKAMEFFTLAMNPRYTGLFY